MHQEAEFQLVHKILLEYQILKENEIYCEKIYHQKILYKKRILGCSEMRKIDEHFRH